jgi:AbrB family looped-hinge helix DNA binding protein
MEWCRAEIDERGRITIPKVLRDLLSLEEEVFFTVKGDCLIISSIDNRPYNVHVTPNSF